MRAQMWAFTAGFLVCFAVMGAHAEDPARLEVTEDSNLSLPRPGGGRPIPVTAYWPSEPGQYPVVLFSHGVGATADMSPGMMRNWASHGYVVVLPTHRNDLTPHTGAGLLRAVKEFRLRSSERGATWQVRVDELKAVLDAIEQGRDLPDALLARADAAHVGLAGHSFGAYTALLVGGATLYDEGQTYDYHDSRLDALVVISGPGRDSFGLTTESFAGLTIPMLVFAGSEDPGTKSEGGPEWRAEPYTLAPPGNAYLAFMNGATHVTYVGGLSGASGHPGNPVKRTVRGIKRLIFPHFEETEAERDGIYTFTESATRCVWDAYLKDDADARAMLRDGGPPAPVEGIVTWSSK